MELTFYCFEDIAVDKPTEGLNTVKAQDFSIIDVHGIPWEFCLKVYSNSLECCGAFNSPLLTSLQVMLILLVTIVLSSKVLE